MAQSASWPFPPLLGDGAMGTYLLPSPRIYSVTPTSTLCLIEPERVLQAHRAYRYAGAQLLQTNSFGADRLSLEGTVWADRVTDIANASVVLAWEAAGGGLVTGSVAGLARPTGWTTAHQREARSAYAELMEALLAAGVDFLLLETMSDLASAALAVETAVEVVRGGDTPVACTIAVSSGLTMACGCSVADAAVRLRDAGVNAFGVNCGDGPATVLAAGRMMRAMAPEMPLILQASAGLPVLKDNVTVWPLPPAEFATFVVEARELGAALVGGCCGTTPAHIAAARPPSA